MNPDAMDKEQMQKGMKKLLPWSFLANLVAAVFVALLVGYAHANGDAMRAAKIGAVAGLGIAGTSMFMHYNWLQKSKAAWAIDTGYAMIGCGLAGWIIGAM
jgi:fluoride ion exporter CrcB/FEX